jgi:hypothetical protein
MLFNLQGAGDIELIIDIGVQKLADFIASHRAPSGADFRGSDESVSTSSACNCIRPRARRDITVPIGTPAILPISL